MLEGFSSSLWGDISFWADNDIMRASLLSAWGTASSLFAGKSSNYLNMGCQLSNLDL